MKNLKTWQKALIVLTVFGVTVGGTMAWVDGHFDAKAKQQSRDVSTVIGASNATHDLTSTCAGPPASAMVGT